MWDSTSSEAGETTNTGAIRKLCLFSKLCRKRISYHISTIFPTFLRSHLISFVAPSVYQDEQYVCVTRVDGSIWKNAWCRLHEHSTDNNHFTKHCSGAAGVSPYTMTSLLEAVTGAALTLTTPPPHSEEELHAGGIIIMTVITCNQKCARRHLNMTQMTHLAYVWWQRRGGEGTTAGERKQGDDPNGRLVPRLTSTARAAVWPLNSSEWSKRKMMWDKWGCWDSGRLRKMCHC